jgi:hypothetical protein
LTGAALILAVLLLTACAAKPPRGGTRVTLLPQADGTPSAVVVRSTNPLQADSEQRLDEPYESALIGRSQPIVVRQGTAGDVRQAYEPLFATAPPPAAKFMLYFRIGTTQLTPESQQAVGRVLIGHTDTTSTGESNDVLSVRRARLVRALFLERGFPPALIEATGRGERDLAVKTRDGIDEPRNRRVEILVR